MKVKIGRGVFFGGEHEAALHVIRSPAGAGEQLTENDPKSTSKATRSSLQFSYPGWQLQGRSLQHSLIWNSRCNRI